MGRKVEYMRALIPVFARLNRFSSEEELTDAEDRLCVAVGDTNFRMTRKSQHHTHHYARSLDAAVMMLQRQASWLFPVVDFSDQTVRLVNGMGLPVAGKDHCSEADTMPVALCLAILRALVDAEDREAAAIRESQA